MLLWSLDPSPNSAIPQAFLKDTFPWHWTNYLALLEAWSYCSKKYITKSCLTSAQVFLVFDLFRPTVYWICTSMLTYGTNTWLNYSLHRRLKLPRALNLVRLIWSKMLINILSSPEWKPYQLLWLKSASTSRSSHSMRLSTTNSFRSSRREIVLKNSPSWS